MAVCMGWSLSSPPIGTIREPCCPSTLSKGLGPRNSLKMWILHDMCVWGQRKRIKLVLGIFQLPFQGPVSLIMATGLPKNQGLHPAPGYPASLPGDLSYPCKEFHLYLVSSFPPTTLLFLYISSLHPYQSNCSSVSLQLSLSALLDRICLLASTCFHVFHWARLRCQTVVITLLTLQPLLPSLCSGSFLYITSITASHTVCYHCLLIHLTSSSMVENTFINLCFPSA